MPDQSAHYYVYIFGGDPRKDVEIGLVDNLLQHVQLSRETAKGANLVYYEHYNEEEVALHRERQIKSGGIDSTYLLVESMNPNWLDLSDTLSF